MTILLAQNFFSWGVVLGVAIISFSLGLLFKITIIRKQRKRVLALENEMLSNHARILSLEKKIAETRSDKNGVQHDMTSIKTDRELRAS